ncbi:hypothetical protein TWF481_009011 [Arthrobotrys musiformis]|uniref:DASH complex subunit DAD4 n=1 Tax=Arthrobotrys musiformis TaxID=47236 RepID=A0AAV9W529_9PEZI
MESPHESQQSLLLTRIIGNVEKLNEAVKEFNNRIREINAANMEAELFSHMWQNYQSYLEMNLEETNSLVPPKQ